LEPYFFGRKLLGIDELQYQVHKIILPELYQHLESFNQISQRLSGFEEQLGIASQSKSPVTLLPKGSKLLQQSGLKTYIDDNL
jgi:hypothetical protein